MTFRVLFLEESAICFSLLNFFLALAPSFQPVENIWSLGFVFYHFSYYPPALIRPPV